MLVATIVRDKKNGRIYVRIAPTAQKGGNVEVIEVLNGEEREPLKKLAKKYIRDHGLEKDFAG